MQSSSDSVEFQAIRARIASCIQELPPLPAVVSRLLTATQDNDVAATELERYLQVDPALSAKVLRVANSAYYGMTKQISSLSQAVVILGIQQLRNMMLSISAMNLLRPSGPTQREAHQRFWLQAITTALSAQILAKRQRYSVADQELAYLVGLMEDVGVLFLMINFPDASREIDRRVRAGETRSKVEVAMLGLTHAQVGQVLAHFWRFPTRIEKLIGNHEILQPPAMEPISYINHAAQALAASIDIVGDPKVELRDEVAAWLAAEPADWVAIADQVRDRRRAYTTEFSAAAA